MVSTEELMDCFSKIMTGYLLLMEQSEIVKKSKQLDMILYNGANIVIHVFTMHVHCNQPVENIVNQCCKSYICYLEYIEQLDKTNLANNLYISDISIFVYKLTLGELELGNSTISVYKPTLDLVSALWNVLLSWNSSFSMGARIAICDVYMKKYSTLFSIISDAGAFVEYIGIIQSKLHMNENVYFVFLNEYYRIISKWKRTDKLPDTNSILEKILMFHTQYYLEEKLTEENISVLVKRLLC